MKKFFIYSFSAVLTLFFVFYQRITGPTYPYSGKKEIGIYKIEYKLLRSQLSGKNLPVRIRCKNEFLRGEVIYRRFPSNDEWTSVKMERIGEFLYGEIPTQPPKGKIEYNIKFNLGDMVFFASSKNLIARFKGAVPVYFLVPHIILIFIGFFYTFVVFLKVLIKEEIDRDSIIAFWAIVIGGLIFGAIVQKFAFGSFWEGFPVGRDITDNKTLLAVLGWLPTVISIKKKKEYKKYLAIISFLITLIAFGIPHSLNGSQIDWTKVK